MAGALATVTIWLGRRFDFWIFCPCFLFRFQFFFAGEYPWSWATNMQNFSPVRPSVLEYRGINRNSGTFVRTFKNSKRHNFFEQNRIQLNYSLSDSPSKVVQACKKSGRSDLRNSSYSSLFFEKSLNVFSSSSSRCCCCCCSHRFHGPFQFTRQ